MADEKNTFRPDDFQLVQTDIRITDRQLDSKPTTFFKDAFRRFCKNKSSVVGAVILSVLVVMAIFIPWLSPHNIENVRTSERFLAPKLFEAGTGFWDGTRAGRHVLYDPINEIPALSDKNTPASIKQSLISLKVDPEPTLIDSVSPYGVGGCVVVATDAADNLFVSGFDGSSEMIFGAAQDDTINLYDATLNDIVATSADANAVAVAFRTGETALVATTENLSPTFTLANGDSYVYNRAAGSWQQKSDK